MDIEKNYKKIKTYGRSIGKSLSNNQLTSMNEYFEKHSLDDFLNQYDNFILEIGFGNSENLFWLSERNSNTGIIGIDPFKNSCSRAILKLKENNQIHNIFIINNDALELLNQFTNCLFEKIYVLFPDPWPKKKHNKRRILNEENLNNILQKTKSHIYFATDNRDYFESVVLTCNKIPSIEIEIFNQKPDNFSVLTKYEQKAIDNGTLPMYMIIKKS